VACHRWREIEPAPAAVPSRGHNAALARLQAAFIERGT